MDVLDAYTVPQLITIAVCTFAFSTAKGGFPAGIAAMPVLILLWPNSDTAARDVIAYMLPLLVLMDACGMCFYRKQINWAELRPMIWPTLAGVVIATGILHVVVVASSDDRPLKLFVGTVGIVFVAYQCLRMKLLKKNTQPKHPNTLWLWFCGVLAGLTSTLCHIGGTAAQAYYLSRPLEKMTLAATVVGFFFFLNLVKLVAYSMLDVFSPDILILAAWMSPTVPLGVFAGYLITKALRSTTYVALLYATMLIASIGLIIKAL